MEKGNLSSLICAGFPQKDILDAFKVFEKYPPGMVLLFSDNVEGREELKELCKRIKKIKGKPLVAVDMEGGRVNRLKKILGELPPAEEYGKWEEEKIERMAFEWGMEMKGLGIDVDFAPCVDLGPVKEGTGLEGRILSKDKEEVKRKGFAFLRGLGGAGIIGCIKHYPGLGASEVDSHFKLPVVNLDKKELKKHIEIFEFLKGYSPMIMVAHCIYKCLDENFPASLSEKIIKKIKPYNGLIISDDLEMGALSSYGSISERAYLSLKAGCGMVIISHKFYEIPSVVQKLKFKSKIIDYLKWKRRSLKYAKRTFAA
ncbi:MAG: glycoside hydrolase family 3 N-terminal domain-containing protein [Thermoanaerobaculia bacterium]